MYLKQFYTGNFFNIYYYRKMCLMYSNIKYYYVTFLKQLYNSSFIIITCYNV